MLRHSGKGRTHSHNLRLASLLSAVAGMVNSCGLLGLGTLTTNVTGHFAYFAEELFLQNYGVSLVYMVYVVVFFLGAFMSGLLTDFVHDRLHMAYFRPLAVEVAILIAVAVYPVAFGRQVAVLTVALSCALLFAMGMQNALVTRVSQSVVRTTHLTGLFTDLGIELAQAIRRRGEAERAKLNKGIRLKLMIIVGFFVGGLVGGFAYQVVQLKALLLPAAVLSFTMWYDQLLFRFYLLRRKLRHR